MAINPKIPDAARRRALAVGAGVVLAHIGVFALLSIGRPPVEPPVVQPTIDVDLVRPLPPPPPPPPPPPAPPAKKAGGGAPAAPSVVHTPPKPRPAPREVPAPPVKAPEQPLVIGAAPVATPTPGLGQGGQGQGTGTGIGDGDGPGSGGFPPMILRRASGSEILALVPPQARAARQAGRAGVRCVIQLDTRLDDCHVVGESPPGFGFGEAALIIVPRYSRFRPPLSANGRPVPGQTVVVTVEFGRQNGR